MNFPTNDSYINLDSNMFYRFIINDFNFVKQKQIIYKHIPRTNVLELSSLLVLQ